MEKELQVNIEKVNPKEVISQSQEKTIRGSREKEIDSLWYLIQPEVERYFTERYNEKIKKATPEDIKFFKEDLEEDKNRGIEREYKFFTSVLAEALRFYEDGASSSENIILFDIDGTLAKTLYYGEGDDDFTTAIRPSAVALFSWLKEEMPEIKLGFITSRFNLLEQLEDENGLKPIGSFFDKESLYSTKEHGREIERAAYSGEKEKWNYILQHHDVKNDIKKTIEKGGYDNLPEISFDVDKAKLELLNLIHEKNPGSRIMVVDDSDYVKFLEYGVCLYPDAIFSK